MRRLSRPLIGSSLCRTFRVAAIALAFALCCFGTAQAAGPHTCTNVPLTTYFSDLDSQGLPSDIASDGLGAYHDNLDGVTSFLTCAAYNGLGLGDWQFDSYSSASRRVNESLDMDDAVQPGDPHYTAPANPPYWGRQSLKAHIEVKCTLVYNDMHAMAAGSSFTCPLLNRFNTAGNIDYNLGPAESFFHYPETTDAKVTCNTADSGGCNDWFIDPIVPGQAVGRLQTPSTQKGKPQGPTDDGDFYMHFHIHLTRP
ncbi:MAG TPA: hypothetical protein VKG01_03155 [Thermoanaerobaculia bacterium]|nr:hypothetical protein [Thermoanaerobaculia bacterium]